MAISFRVLSSCFRRLVFTDSVYRSLNTHVHPAARTTFHTCSIRRTAEEPVKENTVTDNNDNLAAKLYVEKDPNSSLVFDGVAFDDIPVVHIKAAWNNTFVLVRDPTVTFPNIISKATCGSEGFKNAKKGTSVAAQATAIAAATKAVEKGVKMVRVMVKGIGPGRQAAVKGLQMGGLEIISITDNTPVPHNKSRPRKARRL